MEFNLDYLLNNLAFNIKDTPYKKLSLEELSHNLFSYLDDYQKMGFSFINLPNKLINISNGQDRYSLFGDCFLGYFVIDKDEKVLLISNDEGYEVFQDKIVFVNSSLKLFVSSYSLFLSKVFVLKSKFFEIKGSEMEDISRELMEEVLALEKDSTNQITFWEHIAYLIEDDGIVLRNDVTDYIKEGE